MIAVRKNNLTKMKSVPLKAFPRSLVQRGGVKKLRASGRVPATIYGRLAKPQNLEVGFDDITDVLHHSVSENLLVDLSVENDPRAKRLAMLQEIQHHPLNGKVLHVDFHEIAEDEKAVISVPLETSGEPVGVKVDKGTLEHVLFKIKVRALPKDLPELIVVDVSNLGVGQTIHLSDVVVPDGVEILGDKHISVVSVAAPRTEEETAGAAEGGASTAEVEMTKEKKEEAASSDAKKK